MDWQREFRRVNVVEAAKRDGDGDGGSPDTENLSSLEGRICGRLAKTEVEEAIAVAIASSAPIVSPSSGFGWLCSL